MCLIVKYIPTYTRRIYSFKMMYLYEELKIIIEEPLGSMHMCMYIALLRTWLSYIFRFEQKQQQSNAAETFHSIRGENTVCLLGE